MSKDLPDETPELAAAVPPHLLEGLREYAINHRPTGDFLRTVLQNDLHGAIARADVEGLRHIRAILEYVMNALPAECWGNEAKVASWLDRRSAMAKAKMAPTGPVTVCPYCGKTF